LLENISKRAEGLGVVVPMPTFCCEKASPPAPLQRRGVTERKKIADMRMSFFNLFLHYKIIIVFSLIKNKTPCFVLIKSERNRAFKINYFKRVTLSLSLSLSLSLYNHAGFKASSAEQVSKVSRVGDGSTPLTTGLYKLFCLHWIVVICQEQI
jgi:hypothetical protein